MLKQLRLENVGPAETLELNFQPRMNFFVGDNGLGKTFLLDVAWWALTRTWARGVAMPHAAPSQGRIAYAYDTKAGKKHQKTILFDRSSEQWPIPAGRPPIPGLVIYAQVDGGFSVWDPARNYWKKGKRSRPNWSGF